ESRNPSIASCSDDGTRGTSLASYAFPTNISGGSIWLAIPFSPAAIVAANARYGFASAPGILISTRKPPCSPTVLNPQVRLSRLQTIAVGAHEPSWYRL